MATGIVKREEVLEMAYMSRARRLDKAVSELNDTATDMRTLAEEIEAATSELDDNKETLSELTEKQCKDFHEKADNFTMLDFSEIESLGEEMRNWADGLSGTNLENSEKYQRIEEAADTCENVDTNIEIPAAPETNDKTEWEEFADALNEAADSIENETSNLDGVDFPSMYG